MLRRMAVAAVELVRPQPDWEAALTRALERPRGVRERRERPAEAPSGDGIPRRRIADELAWLREVVDDPGAHDFACEAGAAHLWWPVGAADTAETLERLERLRVRGVLDAAGFLLHEETLVE